MTTVVDRPLTEVKPLPEVEVLAPVAEKPPEPQPKRFVRWMGWLVTLLVVAGLGVIVWSVISEEPMAPTLEAIDPHQSPEVFHLTAGAGLMAPALEAIDVHESPEVAGLAGAGLMAPALEAIDVHESPEVAGLAGAGLMAPGLEAIDVHESPEVAGLAGSSLATIDPHESPEIQRLGS